MDEQKKETPMATEVSKVCSNGCDFKPVEPDDRFCGKCGTELVLMRKEPSPYVRLP